jgi:beta-glucosidase
MEEIKLKNLLEKMTLKEKIMQLYQSDLPTFNRSSSSDLDSTGPVTGPENNIILDKESLYSVGSILNCNNAKNAYNVQKEYMENNRLGIPLLFMFDVVHGFRTIFPIPLALACSWNPDLIEETARIAAKEGSASGNNVTFAPMSDLVRDPRWGRVMESQGEDPLLNALLSAAYVRGFQGNDLKDQETMAACVKHFAGYGASEAGRDYNTVDMSEQKLRNFYLSGYQKSIEAGAEMVMTSFNIFKGVPATANKFLLRDLLRDEMGFDGTVISDYDSLTEIIDHGAARDGKEAARRGIEAGLDIEMVSTEYIHHLEDLVLEGTVEESLIDEAVMRILKLKNLLGLFEDPFRYIEPEREEKTHLHPEHRKLARSSAAESAVLLKNDEILPLEDKIDQLESIALIGPLADNGGIIGFWNALGKNEEAVTLKEGLENKYGDRLKINVEAGYNFETEQLDLEAVEKIVEKSDLVILALGEEQNMSGEGGSRAYLDLPGPQKKIAETAADSNKPAVLVLFNGRPLELKWYDDNMTAILESWFPGTEGGNALANLLNGDVNPSAKLTMSFPYTVGQIPVYYNHYSTGRSPEKVEDKNYRFLSRYQDIPNQPLYPFGFGLSYNDYEYSKPELSSKEMKKEDTISASIEIENLGSYSGKEIVQLYIRDLYGTTVRPVKELKDFMKISLEPGESKRIEFEIIEDMLKFYNLENKQVIEAGEFEVFIGANSRDLNYCGKFEYKD